MKKLIILTMLLMILSVCALSAGVCFADETSTYYYVEKDKELTVYISPQRTSGIALQIPATYAFKYIKDENGDFAAIEYNGCQGYVLLNDFNVMCKKVDAKWGENPYEYTFKAQDFDKFKSENIVAYTYNGNSLSAVNNPTPSNLITIKNVYGYFKDGNQTYILVDIALNVGIGYEMLKHYIKADDIQGALELVNGIPQSAGYIAQTTPDKPTVPSGDSNSGDNNTPNVGDNNSDTQTPKNSLDRYIMIAVIAVLCVVIIILIFAPTKKRQG